MILPETVKVLLDVVPPCSQALTVAMWRTIRERRESKYVKTYEHDYGTETYGT